MARSHPNLVTPLIPKLPGCDRRWLLSVLFGLLALGIGGGCSYLGTVVRESRYALHQRSRPELKVYKHMLTRETFYVFGVLNVAGGVPGQTVAVAAISDALTPGEVVDVNHGSRADSYYSLNLPDGTYRLVVLTDRNADGFYDETEVTTSRDLTLNPVEYPDRVRGDVDIVANETRPAPVAKPFRIAVQKTTLPTQSLFFPQGTIRTLDDPIFSPAMAQLGLYEPAAFLERAPMTFYALEEDSYRIPVVFVHGIGGSARDFDAMVAQLDRTRFKPWFFHYASGDDLAQISELFYRIFLSGKLIPLGRMPLVVVAHSMGGVVVREALNRCKGKPPENHVGCFVTIASPLGGHPSARNIAKAPLVIPSWRDLNPDSSFIKNLHRRPLPRDLSYHLFYSYGDDHTVKIGEASDGVVPLSSQLTPAAQAEATAQFGFNATHTGVLKDPAAIQRVLAAISAVQSPIPADHIREMQRGGYDLPLGKDFTSREAYYVRNLGYYLDALVEGRLQPFDPSQVHFIQACRGEKRPTDEVEFAWRKLNEKFPQRKAVSAQLGP